MSKKTILVTGGAGFIGSHVSAQLINDGYQVVIVDDLSGGFESNLPSQAIFERGSITDADFIRTVFKRHSISMVYHLAAYAAEGLSHFVRRFNYTNNLMGSINLIEAAITHEVELFVFFSSIAVYGNQSSPLNESCTPNPIDPYGIAKLAVEQELRAAKEMFGLNYAIFRPHNVYGEHQNFGDPYRNVIGIFINQILHDRPLPIFGDGEQTRAFTYVHDIIESVTSVARATRCWNRTLNIGADQPYSINHIAKTVAHAMGAELQVEYHPMRKEILHCYADHSLFRELFGSSKQTSLDEGIARMVEWARAIGERQSAWQPQFEIVRNLPAVWQSVHKR